MNRDIFIQGGQIELPIISSFYALNDGLLPEKGNVIKVHTVESHTQIAPMVCSISIVQHSED